MQRIEANVNKFLFNLLRQITIKKRHLLLPVFRFSCADGIDLPLLSFRGRAAAAAAATTIRHCRRCHHEFI
jgi:hypothetical protein